MYSMGDTLQMIRNTMPDHGHQHHPHAPSMQSLGRYEDTIQAIRNTLPDHHHGGHHMHNMQGMQNVHLSQNHMQPHMQHMPQPQHQANHNAYNDHRQIPMDEVLAHNLGLAFKLPQADNGINPDQPNMILEQVEAPLLPDPDDYVNSNQYDAHNFGPNMQYDPMMRPPKKPRKKKEKADAPRKKRERHPENWKRNKRKKARDLGKEYVSSRGKVVSEKVFDDKYRCNCRRKCDDRITIEKRKKLFKEYWKIGDWKGQTAYLAKLIVISDVKQRTTSNKDESRRQKSCTFKLGKQRVCKNMFKNTFQISNARIETAIKKRSDNDEEIVDNRGKHAAHNKTPESTMKLVREHISSMKLVREHLHSFPRYNPHYCGRKTERHFLEPGLNVSELYNLYLEWCQKKNISPIKKWLYRSEFDKMNNTSTNSNDDGDGDADRDADSDGDSDHADDDGDDGDDTLHSDDEDDDDDTESNKSTIEESPKNPKKSATSSKTKQKQKQQSVTPESTTTTTTRSATAEKQQQQRPSCAAEKQRPSCEVERNKANRASQANQPNQANAVQSSQANQPNQANQTIANRGPQTTVSSSLWPNAQASNCPPFMQMSGMGHANQTMPNPVPAHQGGFFPGYNDPRVTFTQNQAGMLVPNLSMAINGQNIPNGTQSAAANSAKSLGPVLSDPSLSDNSLQGGSASEAAKRAEAKKKRSRNPDEWKRNKRKYLRDCGKEYQSARGKVIPAKTFNEDFRCECKRKCDEKLPVEDRKKVFEEFWDIGDWKKQTAYLAKLISITEVQQRTTPLKAESRRQKSCIFKIKDEKVCKNMFRNTFQISGGRIDTVLKKLTDDADDDWCDNRGKHSPHNKTPDKVLALVREHIISFPRNQSQFVRRKSDKSSQELGLNVAKLYSHYKEWCNIKNEKPVKEWLYRNEFCRLNLLLPPVTEPVNDECENMMEQPDKSQKMKNASNDFQGAATQNQGHMRPQNDDHQMRPLMGDPHQPQQQQQQPQRPLLDDRHHAIPLVDDCQAAARSHHHHPHHHSHLEPQRQRPSMFDPLRHKSNLPLNGMFDPDRARLAYENDRNKNSLYEAERARAMFQNERHKDPYDPQRRYEMERARMFERNQGNEIPLFDPEGNKVASFWHSQMMHHK